MPVGVSGSLPDLPDSTQAGEADSESLQESRAPKTRATQWYVYGPDSETTIESRGLYSCTNAKHERAPGRGHAAEVGLMLPDIPDWLLKFNTSRLSALKIKRSELEIGQPDGEEDSSILFRHSQW